MKILIVDDEKLALSRLKRILNEEGFLDIQEANNGLDAIKLGSKNSFDLAFLDISMPNINGLELAQTLLEINPNIFIVFQTAFSEHALEAYQSGGIDYLLKPISNESISACMKKVDKYTKSSKSEELTIQSKKIMAKRSNRLYMIDLDDIYYIKADLDEVIIKVKHTDAYARKKMSDMAKILQGRNFFRVHRSYFVNVDKIKSMQSVEQSKLEISFDGIDDVVTSSKDGAKEFREYLEKRSI